MYLASPRRYRTFLSPSGVEAEISCYLAGNSFTQPICSYSTPRDRFGLMAGEMPFFNKSGGARQVYPGCSPVFSLERWLLFSKLHATAFLSSSITSRGRSLDFQLFNDIENHRHSSSLRRYARVSDLLLLSQQHYFPPRKYSASR